ncbi:MAG: sugar transferase [Candidatus Saccharimonadales bacterium]
MYRHGYGVTLFVLVGSSETTYYMSKYLYNNSSGLDIVGIVANKTSVYERGLNLQYRSLQQAIAATNPHAIIQTDSADVVKAYNTTIDINLDYQFIPSHSALFTSKHSVELLGAFPIINVHTTPLVGYGRVLKRTIDIIGGLLIVLATLPITLFIMIVMKITDLQNPIFFKQRRLSRFNKAIYIYKFRTLKSAYIGLTPEEAFTKMGKPRAH